MVWEKDSNTSIIWKARHTLFGWVLVSIVIQFALLQNWHLVLHNNGSLNQVIDTDDFQ